jgi:transcription antitermination factor NusG
MSTSDLPPASAPRKWYAVHTRSRHERVVAAQLRGRGVATYLPLVEEIHRWSDRRKRVQVPVFPGYAFIHACDCDETMATVAQIESVVRIVGAFPGGTPIPDAEMEALQRLLSRNVPCVNHPFLKVGQRVRVRGGALDGVEGTLVACKGETRLVVSIELIQRSLAVRIEGYDVEVV